MLVRVRACGVCGHDVLAREGRLGTPLPAVLGHEIAGDIVDIGHRVTHFRVGDRVALVQRVPCGSCSSCHQGSTNLCVRGPGFYGEQLSGGYAEFVVATELNTVRLPESVSYQAGAIASCAIGTGLRALRRAGVSAVDSVLVTAASGGVGIHTIQHAASLGATVIAVTSSPAKAHDLGEAGASHVMVLPSSGSLRTQLELQTGLTRVDVVVELAGPSSFSETIRTLRHGGRMVLVGNLTPSDIHVAPGLIILKELSVFGSSHATSSDLRASLRAIVSGRVHPAIAAVLPLGAAAAAHEQLTQRAVTGRIVLSPDE